MNFIHFLGLDFLSGEKGEKGDKGDRGEAGGTIPLSIIIDAIYPVGCYFETTDTTFDPNTTFGGTWILEDEGLVHISSGTNYSVSNLSQDGGAKQTSYTPQGTNDGTAISIDQMPSHNHTLQMTRNGLYFNAVWYVGYGSGTNRGGINYNETSAGASPYISKTGGGKTHSHTFRGTAATLNVMQPYKIVNRWHRTA